MALLKLNKLTPEYIQSMLFYFHNAAHKYHLDTRSFAAHKALDFAYTELVGFKDEISEKLMGYMGGDKIGKLKSIDVSEYNESAPLVLANDIMDFAKQLEEWAEEKEYCDIENIAQGLSGLGSKLTYLLNLK